MFVENMRKLYSILLLVLLFAFAGCDNDKGPDNPVLTTKNRTVIAYMVADNNLYSYAPQNINKMERVWSSSFDGYIVVYLYPTVATSASGTDYDDRPRLLLIQEDLDDTKINSRVLKYYDRSQNPNDPETLKLVIQDAKQLAPADNYGLVMWSHGSGWLPGGGPLKNQLQGDSQGGLGDVLSESSLLAEELPETSIGYSFGEGGYTYNTPMEIDDMARALGETGTKFDFLLFDACHMAGIEVAYQLRNVADYFIGSAAEIWGFGFPYDQVVGHMMDTRANIRRIAEEYYNYYANLQIGNISYRDATIIAVDNSKLADVAAEVKKLTDIPITGTFTASQQYGRGTRYSNAFHDLTDLLQTAWGAASLTGYNEAMSRAVVYKAATPSFFGIPNVTYSGFSCYIPRLSTPVALGIYQTRYDWSVASGLGRLAQ